MANIDELVQNGYYIKDVSPIGDENLASFSLKSSMRSYFQTAEDLTNLLKKPDLGTMTVQEVDKACGPKYAVDACDAITHLQHFLELYVKDILQKDSPLLVYDASKKPELLYDIIHSNVIPDDKLEKIKFIEFSEAIDRLKANIDKLDPKFTFLKKHIEMMKSLNTLRNRIAHRGAFVIRYKALDELFCKYVIPLIDEIKQNTPEYTKPLEWGFNLHTKIDVYAELKDEYLKSTVNPKRVYLLKLMANCAYNNDVPYFEPSPQTEDPVDAIFNMHTDYSWIYDERKTIIAKRALGEAEQRFGRVEKCPICGCESFVLENDYYDTDEACVPYVYDASCHHCGFHLDGDLLNPTDFGLPLPDYSQMV